MIEISDYTARERFGTGKGRIILSAPIADALDGYVATRIAESFAEGHPSCARDRQPVIPPGTAGFHMDNTARKLNANYRTQTVAIAAQPGLIGSVA